MSSTLSNCNCESYRQVILFLQSLMLARVTHAKMEGLVSQSSTAMNVTVDTDVDVLRSWQEKTVNLVRI